MTIQEQIALLRKREDTCWDMLEIFLAARDPHGCHDLGVEIQGIAWAIRELEKAVTQMTAHDDVRRLVGEALAARDKAVAECPVNNPPARIPPNCPVCTSTTGEPCWATMRADNRFVDAIRALLSGSQLTKEKP